MGAKSDCVHCNKKIARRQSADNARELQNGSALGIDDRLTMGTHLFPNVAQTRYGLLACSAVQRNLRDEAPSRAAPRSDRGQQ